MNTAKQTIQIEIPLYVDFSELSVHHDIPVGDIDDNQVNELIYVVNNLGFIRQRAHALSSKARNSLVTYEDLYQEGLIAAINAVRSYDATYGASMNTHICNHAKWAMLDYFRHNCSSVWGHVSEKLYAAWSVCRDNPTVENLMAQGLSYRQAIDAIDTFVLDGCSLDDCLNTYDDGAYWLLDKIERESYPLDLDKLLTKREADALRLEYGFADEVETVFPSRKAHQYACFQGVMKLQETPGFEQYLDFLR